jgi:hypothetical protein
MMRGWTIQSYDLRVFEGPIELDRGTYNHDSAVLNVQRQLYDLVKEDGQVIWCSQVRSVFPDDVDRYLHEIDIDSRDIVAIVDTLVWCHLLNYGPRYILPQDHRELRLTAMNSRNDYHTALRTEEDEYLRDNLPTDLWSSVTKKEITRSSDQLLIRFPLGFSDAVSVQIVAEAMVQRREVAFGL